MPKNIYLEPIIDSTTNFGYGDYVSITYVDNCFRIAAFMINYDIYSKLQDAITKTNDDTETRVPERPTAVVQFDIGLAKVIVANLIHKLNNIQQIAFYSNEERDSLIEAMNKFIEKAREGYVPNN